MDRAQLANSGSVAITDDPVLRVAFDKRGQRSRRGSPQVQVNFDLQKFQGMAIEMWQVLAEGESLPSITKLNARIQAHFRVQSMLVGLPLSGSEMRIHHLGLALAKLAGIDRVIESYSDIPAGSVLARIADYFVEVRETRAPVRFDSLVVEGQHAAGCFKGVLLPFADAMGRLAYIYVVIGEDLLALPDHGLVSDLGDNFMVWADEELLLEPEQELSSGSEDAPLELEAPLASALGEILEQARNLAESARVAETRSRKALYQAIGQAYDFAIAAELAPDDLQALLAASGITMQERAPMTPIVKLVFGADYDRTRVAEYAAVLTYAKTSGIGQGELADYLLNSEGGIRGVIELARREKRPDAGATAREVRSDLAKKLRQLDGRPVSSITPYGEEFGVVLVRRLPDGEVVLLGEIGDDPTLIERAGRALLR